MAETPFDAPYTPPIEQKPALCFKRLYFYVGVGGSLIRWPDMQLPDA
jgi:hypothetical protein